VLLNKNIGRAWTFVVCILLIMPLASCGVKNSFPAGSPLEQKNGFDDPSVVAYYKEDIQDVYDSILSKNIRIVYFDADLNSNGSLDKIVIIQSSIHSGSTGDRLDILINDGDGGYTNVSHFHIRILSWHGEHFDAKIYISDVKTNGLHNIIIMYEDHDEELKEIDGANVTIIHEENKELQFNGEMYDIIK